VIREPNGNCCSSVVLSHYITLGCSIGRRLASLKGPIALQLCSGPQNFDSQYSSDMHVDAVCVNCLWTLRFLGIIMYSNNNNNNNNTVRNGINIAP